MKKYMFFILLVIVSFLLCLSFVSAKNSILNNKIIIIDAGHGNKDPGTFVGTIYEKDINLSISFKIKDKLEKMGAKVLMTRTGDYDLAYPGASFRKKSDFDNRINMINKSNADIYLSIHLNYLNDSRYYGPQVFYNKDNKKLALSIQNSLNKMGNNNREIKMIPKDTYMYDKLNIKGVLIECGFLSNEKERKLLINDDYQDRLAKVIIDGIIYYFT